MLAEESSVANPQKIAKIDENIRKIQKIWVGNTGLADEWPNSSVLSMKSVIIGAIDWLSGGISGIGEVPNTFRSPKAKSALVTRWHWQLTEKAESSCIVIGFNWSPSVPGLESPHQLNVYWFFKRPNMSTVKNLE
jgi:hypothetical protein